jgi:hypothetical protein
MMTQHASDLPGFLIIGAQRSGTTSMFHYLSKHPDIFMPPCKEVHYFDLNYDKGIDWYKNFFVSNLHEEKLVGEASPYYIFHPLVAQRVARYLPWVKIIVLLRNPVDRAFSHYKHSRKLNLEYIESFEEAIMRESERIDNEKMKIIFKQVDDSESFRNFSYLNRGLYYQQITKWLQFFPLKQFCFIKSEEFFSNTTEVCVKVCQFLGVVEFVVSKFEPQNVGTKATISPHLKSKMKSYFEDDLQSLSQLLGEKFVWDEN